MTTKTEVGIKHIATVGVYVADQAAAERFWTDKIGFEVKAKHDMGKGSYWLEVGPAGAQSQLVIYPKTLMTNWKELKPSIVFVCEDVQAVYERLKEAGVKVGAPKKMQWGTFCQFTDPDGNEFVIKS